MKHQIRAYILLFIFLFASLVPGQAQEELTRLPGLWHHFQLHKSQHLATNFVGYLQQHYGKGFEQHRSAHDHSGLPMKGSDNHLHAPILVDLPKPIEIVRHIVLVGSQPIVFKNQTAPQSFLHDIWQPPRSC